MRERGGGRREACGEGERRGEKRGLWGRREACGEGERRGEKRGLW